jgi:predicted DNA-binding transcriptional regulator YafY
MPKKKDDSRSYGQKLIRAFAKLLFSKERHSHTELARLLDCSKATVGRLIRDIREAYGVEIEVSIQGRQNFYKIIKHGSELPVIPLTEPEMTALQMCKTFTEHLLGNSNLHDAACALEKNLMACSGPLPSRHFASFSTGTIDYSPHQENLGILIKAMNNLKICQLTYQAIMQQRPKTYLVCPLKIFAYRDTVYLHARMAADPGKPAKKPDFDPLLAIHRLKKVEITDRGFEYPADYNFNDVFDKNFGLMKDDSFEVTVEFTGWAAHYVAERTWSPNQKITHIDEGKIRLEFFASSEVELIAWILSFGEDARVIAPDWLVEEIVKKANKTAALYGHNSTTISEVPECQ